MFVVLLDELFDSSDQLFDGSKQTSLDSALSDEAEPTVWNEPGVGPTQMLDLFRNRSVNAIEERT